MGVLGMMFGLGESALKELGDTYVRVEYPEALETMAAGAITGALFRSPRGPRQVRKNYASSVCKTRMQSGSSGPMRLIPSGGCRRSLTV